jgi:hypothetical protein
MSIFFFFFAANWLCLTAKKQFEVEFPLCFVSIFCHNVSLRHNAKIFLLQPNSDPGLMDRNTDSPESPDGRWRERPKGCPAVTSRLFLA